MVLTRFMLLQRGTLTIKDKGSSVDVSSRSCGLWLYYGPAYTSSLSVIERSKRGLTRKKNGTVHK